ncbi:MAG TPA: hypothetical protein VLI06_14020 [Solimonas sp.]|nr:hypothetical protein [Solimonas sp.]
MTLMQRQMPDLGAPRPLALQSQRQAPQLPTTQTASVPMRGPSLPAPAAR